MKIDFTQQLTNFKGQPLKLGDDELTLGFAACTALLNTFPGEQIDGAEKALRYNLAKAIQGGEAEVTSQEVDVIKDLVGKTFGPPVVGPTYELLEAARSEAKALKAATTQRAEDGKDQPRRKGRA